ncbi:MAG: DUF5317 domain-containing protein [Clostridiales bacterium]|nr:DUF5317 domain-containing protein [Clostridiales bacterium]
MLIESIILAFVFGFIFGGELKNLEKIDLKKMYLVLLAFSIEYIAGLLINGSDLIIRENILDFTYIIQIWVYLLLALFFVFNFKYLGIKFLAFGSFLNFLVIMINRGMMPVKTELALKLGYYNSIESLMSGKVFGHEALNFITSQWIFLADIIDIPPPYFFPKTISIGDIFIGFGVFFLIFFNMFYSKDENNPI